MQLFFWIALLLVFSLGAFGCYRLGIIVGFGQGQRHEKARWSDVDAVITRRLEAMSPEDKAAWLHGHWEAELGDQPNIDPAVVAANTRRSD